MMLPRVHPLGEQQRCGDVARVVKTDLREQFPLSPGSGSGGPVRACP